MSRLSQSGLFTCVVVFGFILPRKPGVSGALAAPGNAALVSLGPAQGRNLLLPPTPGRAAARFVKHRGGFRASESEPGVFVCLCLSPGGSRGLSVPGNGAEFLWATGCGAKFDVTCSSCIISVKNRSRGLLLNSNLFPVFMEGQRGSGD